MGAGGEVALGAPWKKQVLDPWPLGGTVGRSKGWGLSLLERTSVTIWYEMWKGTAGGGFLSYRSVPTNMGQ